MATGIQRTNVTHVTRHARPKHAFRITRRMRAFLDSTAWADGPDTSATLMLMLELSARNRDGIIHATAEEVASLLPIEGKRVREILDRLSSPDPDNMLHLRDPEGRYLEKIDGGWKFPDCGGRGRQYVREMYHFLKFAAKCYGAI